MRLRLFGTTVLAFSLCVAFAFMLESCCCDPGPVNNYQPEQLGFFTITGNSIYALNNKLLKIYTLDSGVIHFKTSVVLQGSSQNDGKALAATGSTVIAGETLYNASLHDSQLQGTNVNYYSACDPIIFKNNFAFTISRSGSECYGYDELRVIDISDPASPNSVFNLNIETPYGLAIDNDMLFTIAGNNGLKVFNIQDPANPTLIKDYPDIDGTYVSAESGIVIVRNSNSLQQYDYSDINDLKLLSTLSIQQ
jgi:hypothetical protein